MANSRRSRLSPGGLQEAPAPTPLEGRGKVLLALTVVGALMVLAWFEGGEEPLHPISEDVALPERRP